MHMSLDAYLPQIYAKESFTSLNYAWVDTQKALQLSHTHTHVN